MNSRKFFTFNSDFISVTFDEETSRIAWFGIESSGRDRDKHASFNLSMPGRGAVAGFFKKKAPIKTEKGENSIFFDGGESSAKFSFDGKKEMTLDLTKPSKSNIFDMNWAIKTAPPTIWSKCVYKKNAPQHLKCDNPLVIYKTKFTLPIIIHFPEYGRLEISCDNKDVYCTEELTMSSDFYGLDLGYLNYSRNHNRIHSLHFGFSHLVFKSDKPTDSVSLKFRVMEECYPELPFEDDGRFDGLKRNWLNSFALNRELLDMGDNIYFHGTAHLAIHMKSDMLQIVKKNDEHVDIIRKVFERQVERTFRDAQSPDGDIGCEFYLREKKKHVGALDATPGAIISLVGISNWNLRFAKKWLPNAMKAADYLLSTDSDGDGIFEAFFPGDYMGQPCEGGGQCNWWDNFAFGHKDIYFNYLCHRALRELSALLRRVGMASDAERYEKQLDKFDKVFMDVFYNPETELMAGWISKNGKVHDYGFTFAVSMGINEGLIPRKEGKKMLKKLLSIMKKEGYGDLRFGIPGNVIPIAPSDTIDWPCMSDWGQYENGGLCGMNGFHFLTAMYNVGMTKEADDILFAILNTYEKLPTHSGLMPGYCKSVDWRTKDGVACGYNYLADNYYFLLSVYVGRAKMKHGAVAKKLK